VSHLGERLTALVDGYLGPAEQERAMAHVRHCAACRAELQHEQWVRREVQSLPGAEPSAALLMALKDIGGDPSAVAIEQDAPATHWRLPPGRRAGLALAGAGTVAAGVLGLAYAVGSTAPAADPVRPPVEQFSSEFASVRDAPFSDPAVDVLPVIERRAPAVGEP